MKSLEIYDHMLESFVFSADEEISAMRLELEKYGIQMPAFSKIGGILANEMPVDEAARKDAPNRPNSIIVQSLCT